MDTSKSSSTTRSPSFSEGSAKTSSGKSDASSVGKERDEDFTKDNAASPVDLECQIQAERITKLLDEVIYKTKLSICLPKLVHEFNILSSILSPHHLDDLVFIIEQYDNAMFSTSLLNMAAMEDIKGGDISLKNRLNPELGHLLYILVSYPQLRDTIEDMITEMKLNYEINEKNRPEPWLAYLQQTEQFRDLMLRQMTGTAADELAAKYKIRRVEGSNAKLIADIETCAATLNEETKRFNETMALKAEIIAKLEREVSLYKHESDIKLKKKILDSDRQMVLATRSHDVKYEMLKDEDIETKAGYENVLKRHLTDETNQRVRRCKVEAQLLSWLQKYDLEMGDKQADLDSYDNLYKDEFDKVEDLEEKLAEQNTKFIPLMEEREIEYHQEMTEKLNWFLVQHAARVIQYSWRNVLANRAEKKKLKKLEKKMLQAAEEALKKRPVKK